MGQRPFPCRLVCWGIVVSITVTKDVFYDGDNCLEWAHGVTGEQPRNSEAYEKALVQCGFGRFRRNGFMSDLCSACQTPAEKNLTAERRFKAIEARTAANIKNGVTYVPVQDVGR